MPNILEMKVHFQNQISTLAWHQSTVFVDTSTAWLSYTYHKNSNTT